jgi:hypothetical protein
VRRTGAAILAATALALTAAQYGVTAGYGFYYDDYHFVRPFSAADVLQTFHGPWDASGIETAYYRPLTICLYALRFALFGLNAEGGHILSLAMFAAAAFLFGLLAARLTGTIAAGWFGVAVFVVHPGMPYSAAAWITNQMHLAELLVVLAALLWWFRIRRRSLAWWLPLLAFQLVAFLIKEDGVVLIPLIVCLHTLRKTLAERDLPHVPIPFLASALVLLAGALALRGYALQNVPPHRLPGVDQAWTNLTRGLAGPFRLVPARRPWQPAASWFVTLVPVAALLAWTRLTPPVRFTLIAGGVAGLAFDLPFIFIVKAEQLHLVTAGACLLLTASVAGLLETAGASRAGRLCVAAAAAAGLCALSAVARNITRDFEPFGPIVLRTDRIVQEWAAVPAEIREYLAAKAEPGGRDRIDPNPARALRYAAFGLHGREPRPDGGSAQWMSRAAVDIFVARDTRLITIPLRHEIGAFREPAHVTVSADGQLVSEADFSDGRWQSIDVNLKPRRASRLTQMHHLRLQIAHAWIPAEIIPGSQDRRTLGLQVGAINAR